jgi:hypothetical protein
VLASSLRVLVGAEAWCSRLSPWSSRWWQWWQERSSTRAEGEGRRALEEGGSYMRRSQGGARGGSGSSARSRSRRWSGTARAQNREARVA